ncbi:hypothetical protein ABW19_dt0206217 [Dactylella cylindrospora]|nr:hypothetical protein ABW19_dt0206217 [Dactylella cylindrospora]
MGTWDSFNRVDGCLKTTSIYRWSRHWRRLKANKGNPISRQKQKFYHFTQTYQRKKKFIQSCNANTAIEKTYNSERQEEIMRILQGSASRCFRMFSRKCIRA